MARTGRIVKLTFRTSLAVMAGLLVATLFLVATGPGLELLRRGLVYGAGSVLTGAVEVRQIRGSLLSEVHLEDFVLHDDEGRPAVGFERLTLAWRPFALTGGVIDVERLELVAPFVRAVQTSTGGLNLARLVSPSETPSEPAEDGPLALPSFRVSTLAIKDADIRFENEGQSVIRAALERVRIAAHGGDSEVNAVVTAFEGTAQDGLPFSMVLEAALDDDELAIEGLIAKLDGARLEVPQLSTTLPPGQLRGRASISVPARVVARLGGPIELLADTELDLRASKAEESPWVAALVGRLGVAPISLSATVAEDLSRSQLALRTRRLDLSRVWQGLPSSQLNVDIDANGPLAPDPDLKARVSVKGELQPTPDLPRLKIDQVLAQLRWRGDAARADLQAKVGAARLRFAAAVADLTSTPVIEQGRVELKLPRLRELVGLSGQATLTATVAGPVESFAAAGELQLDRFDGGDLKLGRADIEWRLSDLPFLPRGQAKLHVDALRLPGRRLDGVDIELNAQSRDGTLDVALPRLAVGRGQPLLAGTGGRLTLSPKGQLDWQGVDLSGPVGAIQLNLEAAGPKPLAGRFTSTATLALDLARIPRRLVPELAQARGRLEVQANWNQHRARSEAAVRLDATRIALAEERPSLEAEGKLDFDSGKLRVTLDVEGLAREFRLDAEGHGPRNALDSRGWTRAVQAGPIEQAEISIEDLSLRRLQRWLGQTPSTTGVVSVLSTVSRRGRAAQVQLDARDIRTGPPLEAAKGSAVLLARFEPGRLTAEGVLNGEPFGQGTLSATVSAPPHLFATRGWQRLSLESLQGAYVDFRRLELSALDDLGLVPGLGGTLSVRAEAGAAARPLTAEVAVEKLRTAGLDGFWDGSVAALISDTNAQLRADVAFDDTEALTARVDAPLPLETLLTATPDGLRKLPVQARVRTRLPIAPFLEAAGTTPGAATGTLVVNLEAQGPAGDLDAELDATIEALTLGTQGFEPLTVRATLDGRKAFLRTRIATDARSELNLVASATVAEDLSAEGTKLDAHLGATGLPLGFLSSLGVAPLGIDGHLHADVDAQMLSGQPEPRGWMELRDLRVVFAQAALPPLSQGLLRVDVSPKTLELDLRARALDGRLVASAEAALAATSKVGARIQLERFPIDAGQRARVSLLVLADGTVARDTGTRLDVQLTKGKVGLEDGSTRALHPVTSPAEVEFVRSLDRPDEGVATASTATAAATPVVVTVRAREPIDVFSESKLVDARVDVDIVSRTGTARDGVRGRVWIPEGEVYVLGRKYRIDRGQVVLEGRSPPNPRLAVLLTHQFLDEGLDFFVRVGGYADAPEVELSSSPARYDKPELIAIFQGTHPADLDKEDSRSQEDQVRDAALGAAAGFLASQIKELTKELPQYLQLDTLEVDVDQGGLASLTVGKWLSRQVFLAYRYNENPTSSENQSEAVVRYRFLPGWLVEIVTGIQRSDLDLMWVKRFDD